MLFKKELNKYNRPSRHNHYFSWNC